VSEPINASESFANLLQLANVCAHRHSMTATTIARPGRNELCHCGSGRKYKHCCLEKDNADASAARKAAAEAVEQSSAVSETPDAATVKTVRSPKRQNHQPWKAAGNTRGFGNRTRTPRKAGGARKAGSE
jgi:hypothetical protein